VLIIFITLLSAADRRAYREAVAQLAKIPEPSQVCEGWGVGATAVTDGCMHSSSGSTFVHCLGKYITHAHPAFTSCDGWAQSGWLHSEAAVVTHSILYFLLYLQEALEAVQAARCASQVGICGFASW
jgi:hypothetical protein